MELGQEDDENFGSSLAVIMHGNVAAQVIENRGTEHDSTRLVPDVSNRNPSNLNSFFREGMPLYRSPLEFTDVIGEPHGFRSHDCVYSYAFRTYNWAKNAAIYSCRSCVGVPWRSVAVVTLLVLVLSTSGV
ncbi:unnamed protein product [Porites lobata]|uniref:Caveolin n=1 Tax=Porites lobata TaxID=104759 RepID=A0ABN8SFX5_9CNID|nr:unnamed protein product [Porites lobata]